MLDIEFSKQFKKDIALAKKGDWIFPFWIMFL